jgi:luciferase family oxidoreductase group 1
MMTTLVNEILERPGGNGNIPFSVLDLSPIPSGSDAGRALRNTKELAQTAERWGYHRYWLAEHHNMPGIASAATSIVIGLVAENTSTIRVGAGGIMLPNHSPLVIAEQFGTLESLYPGRIDLGLGRAPGSDQVTAFALRRDQKRSSDTFPDDVQELIRYFGDPYPSQKVHAVPGEGLKVPIWLLGSSLFSAQLAAAYGLPYAYASHFAPDYMLPALQIYRESFRPSEFLGAPFAMLGLNVVAADTDSEAQYLFTSVQQQFANLRRGTPTKLPPPVESMDGHWTLLEREQAEHMLKNAVVGSPDTVKRGLLAFIEKTGADELMITSHIHSQQARLHSFEIVADLHATVSFKQASPATA